MASVRHALSPYPFDVSEMTCFASSGTQSLAPYRIPSQTRNRGSMDQKEPVLLSAGLGCDRVEKAESMSTHHQQICHCGHVMKQTGAATR